MDKTVDTIEVKDPKGNVVGYVETQENGDQVLRDVGGNIKGYYDKSGDYTRGPDQNILAKGNRLRSLIC